jgi:diguanylate cyclase (GGDEF)-like protein
MKNLAYATELNTIFASMHGKPLPQHATETSANFRFEPLVEQSFLRFYLLRIRRFVYLTGILFLAFIVLELTSEGMAFASLPLLVLLKAALLGLSGLLLVGWILQHTHARQPQAQLYQLLTPFVVVMPIAANLTALIHSNRSTFDIMTASVGLFYCVMLVTLILRMSVNYNRPLVLAVGAITIATIWGTGANVTIPFDVHSCVAVIFGVFACAVFEYDIRSDFVGHAQLYRIATTDPLSKTLNRHAFFERGQMEIDRARRYNGALSLLMIDIDRFKQINDTFGHPIGDQVIASISDTCRHSLRSSDLFGRVGGEEFAILLPDTDLGAALIVAERLRIALESHIETPTGILSVTVSIGVAQLSMNEPLLQELISRADIYLYAAKRTGRNRVVSSQNPEILSERSVGQSLDYAAIA